MRFFIYPIFILAIAGCSGTRNIPSGSIVNSGALNGTWAPVQQEIGGNPLPEALFKKQRLTIADSTYTLVAESVDKGVVQYTGDKMDIFGREGVNKGKHFTAIYKLENGKLTVCYNLKGDAYPATFETKGNPLFFMSVFVKE